MKVNVHAGHNPDGMIAHGAIGYIKESTENRFVCGEVVRQLQGLGHTVYDCTVNNGTSASDVLRKIVTKCNSHKVDLDVSIHFNAFNGLAKGTETLVYSNTSIANTYAKRINDAIVSMGYSNRGVKIRSELYVLRNTKSPALLVECCFCDNKSDVAKYDYKKMASAIVKGITGQTLGYVVTENDNQVVDDMGPVTEAKELYRVQVGAYGVRENAEAMLEKIEEAGFDAFVTGS